MAVMTALAIASIVASIAGNVIKAKAEKKAAKEQQRVAEFEATQAEVAATDATRRGVEGEGSLRREVRSLQGTQRAGYAAQGVELGAGSDTPTAVATSTEGLLQSDLARLRRNAEREALGFKGEAADLRLRGQYALQTGRAQVAATVLGGAADATLLASRMDWGRGQSAAGLRVPARPVGSSVTSSSGRALSTGEQKYLFG